MSAVSLRIGLTGGIGSGKSSAAAAFVARGATLIDADSIARSLTRPGGTAITPLRQAFGDAAIAADGALDRTAMRERAFADTTVRQRLEAILHPMIARRAALEAALARSSVVVYDIPLLTETSHWRLHADRVLVIDCSAETQVERVLRRPGWTRENAERAIAAQSPRAARRALADAVIHNDGAFSLEQLSDAVDVLLGLWKHLVPNAVEQ